VILLQGGPFRVELARKAGITDCVEIGDLKKLRGGLAKAGCFSLGSGNAFQALGRFVRLLHTGWGKNKSAGCPFNKR